MTNRLQAMLGNAGQHGHAERKRSLQSWQLYDDTPCQPMPASEANHE